MAAMLDRNNYDGKSVILPESLANREVLKCSGCQITYTLAYGALENRMEDNQNVLSMLRSRAQILISESHPAHAIPTYVWGGPKMGWLDRERATAAGL
jgi:hypothetical protein